MSNFFDSYNTENMIQYLDEAFEVLNEKNVVKLDKMTMKKKIMTRATLAAAKSANDPLYTKYVFHTKKRKMYRRAIQEKYASKARAVVKQWVEANKED